MLGDLFIASAIGLTLLLSIFNWIRSKHRSLKLKSKYD